jgi:hypothetical protein
MATLSNKDRVGKGLDLLAEGLLPFISPRMAAAAGGAGGDWVRLIEARDEAKHALRKVCGFAYFPRRLRVWWVRQSPAIRETRMTICRLEHGSTRSRSSWISPTGHPRRDRRDPTLTGVNSRLPSTSTETKDTLCGHGFGHATTPARRHAHGQGWTPTEAALPRGGAGSFQLPAPQQRGAP